MAIGRIHIAQGLAATGQTRFGSLAERADFETSRTGTEPCHRPGDALLVRNEGIKSVAIQNSQRQRKENMMGFLTNHAIALRSEYRNDSTAQAVKRLLDRCEMHQGGSTFPLNDFLLSLYNGGCWAPDMQLLCYRIDHAAFEDVITVMRGYSVCGKELHEYFVNGNRLFEDIARRVPMREPGGYCDDHWVLPLGQYLDAVIDYLAHHAGEASATQMVLRAQSGGFFNRHPDDERLRRRVCVASDAQAIREQAERDTNFLTKGRESVLRDEL
jgi:hypothetical protein